MQLYCRKKEKEGGKRTTYRKKEPWGRNSHSTGKDVESVRACDAKGERKRERESRIKQGQKNGPSVAISLYSDFGK